MIALLLVGLASCQPSPTAEGSQILQLGSSKENGVEVTIRLTRAENQQISLLATFIPLEPDLHLYSKDIPKNGVEGLGRPTLFELGENSQLTALGELTESVPPEISDFEPRNLLVYPPGEVTLRLPIALPSGACWLDESVLVTYMACSETGCKAPVIGKTIEVRVPCADTAVNP